MVWLTGIVALQTVDQDVEGQTRQALEHMTLLLHKAGTDPTHLLRLNVYLADIRCADRMYKAWNEYFEGLGLSEGQRPVRITHEARLKNEGFRVEVHAEAVLPAK
jgi:enamine deaminase RidA (YjgF/YER057c/UK114 family)